MSEVSKKADEIRNKYQVFNKLYQQNLEEARISLVRAIFMNLKKTTLSGYQIAVRIEQIMSILQKPLISMRENPQSDYRKSLGELVELYNGMQPNVSNKIFGIWGLPLLQSPREKIKQLLNLNENIRKDIDQQITGFLEAQRDIIANQIACENAIQQYLRIANIKDRYPGKSLEVLILKRHEVSSDVHKLFGLNPDTGLDAKHFQAGGLQSPFELSAVKMVQSVQARLLKETGIIHHLGMIVSPVSRSHETAKDATFSHDIPDSTVIDNYFAEKQWSVSFMSSSRATVYSSKIANIFRESGYQNVSSREDFIINGEDESAFKKRLTEACSRLTMASPSNKMDEVNMKVIVGHGAMNRELLTSMHRQVGIGNIPASKNHLDYGSHYELMVVREGEGKIEVIEFGGNFNRFGFVNVAPVDIAEEHEEKFCCNPGFY